MVSRMTWIAWDRGSDAARICAFLCALVVLGVASRTAAGTFASAVLGQTGFYTNVANSPGPSSLSLGSNFAFAAIDRTSSPNHIYIADYVNNRVLGYANVTAVQN